MEIKIRHQGVDHKAEAQVIKDTLWVHFNGRTFAVDAQPQSRRRKKAGAGASSDTVLAPMPGKVTKILVNVGQEITKGQAVLVMEAMKMEYTLKAEIAGKIAQIECKTGDQVVLGKTMVKIEPAKA
ncbi:acetyl-CoA carboxylase biotin carboxyl carrier protein subunit [Bdellovibrio sp. HCB337]|uniref:acetyl-CoA carboxylase biotin carboxyl carrier protein subunit n=1 Tax=Bdellovibrio sp. HCB337 TaxID=3394358 RepID=UPI0039A6EABB